MCVVSLVPRHSIKCGGGERTPGMHCLLMRLRVPVDMYQEKWNMSLIFRVTLREFVNYFGGRPWSTMK